MEVDIVERKKILLPDKRVINDEASHKEWMDEVVRISQEREKERRRCLQKRKVPSARFLGFRHTF